MDDKKIKSLYIYWYKNRICLFCQRSIMQETKSCSNVVWMTWFVCAYGAAAVMKLKMMKLQQLNTHTHLKIPTVTDRGEVCVLTQVFSYGKRKVISQTALLLCFYMKSLWSPPSSVYIMEVFGCLWLMGRTLFLTRTQGSLMQYFTQGEHFYYLTHVALWESCAATPASATWGDFVLASCCWI